MAELYPLRFEPLFRRYLWGGRRLQTVLGKPIGEGDDYAESWEVVDHGEDQSIVRFGSLAGTPLTKLVSDFGEQLFGRHHPQPQFPLLFKFLDAQRTLSVQVHPNDEQAAQLDPPDNGKTEAWVIMDAEPGSVLYVGLKRGFDKHALRREISRGTCELCLHQFEVTAGDSVFLPAGMVHAIGAGLLVAEIQQASDVTYRLYDWNRVGPDGKPRELHVEQGLEAIDYKMGPGAPQSPQPTDRPHVERMVESEKFILDRWRLNAVDHIGGDDRFHIIACIEGALRIAGDPGGELLDKGETALLPASAGPVELEPQGITVLLDMYLP